jgi:hypothetical protein
MSESNKRLHIHLNFCLLPLGVMGKKRAAQTESSIIEDPLEYYDVPALPRLFVGCLDQPSQR